MRKLKKTTNILMVIILLFMQMLALTNTVKATGETETVQLHSRGEVSLFKYNGVVIPVNLVFYTNVEQPAYSLIIKNETVTQEEDYNTVINQLETNNAIWRAISNGYPYMSAYALDCETDYEAYVATQMAIYHTYYGYEIAKFGYNTGSEAEIRVQSAFKRICAKADVMTSKKVAQIEITDKNQNWKVDNIDPRYVSKTYSVETESDFYTYQVSKEGENINSLLITNENNIEVSAFSKGKKFKTLMPIAELNKDAQYTISVQTNLNTKPVYHAQTTTQQYAVVAQTYEVAKDKVQDRFHANTTEIQILKQDGEGEKPPLANAKFRLLDTSNNVLFTDLTTDSNGICRIKQLSPGTYYLQEVQAPEGYYKYEEKVEVTVGLDEKVIVTVNNFKIPDRQYTEKPQDGEALEVGTKPTIEILPETGF